MRRAPLIIAVFPLLAQAQGPIETRNGQSASLAFLRLDPRGGLLAPGERSLSVSFLSANNLRFEGGFREDQETERLGIRYGWGLSRGEWMVEVPFLTRGGGFQDSLIEGYHSLIGISNFRGTIAYGRIEERIPGSGSFGSATGLGDVVGTYSRPIGPQALWSVALKLPTGNAGGLLGSGAVDVGASIYSRWKLGPRWNLYGQLGVVFQGDSPRLAHNRSLIDQESLALEYRVNSRDRYVLQWQSEPSALVTGEAFPDGPHRQLTLGYTRRLGSHDSLQAYFNEDGDFLNFSVPELVNIAPDFTIGLRWTRKW